MMLFLLGKKNEKSKIKNTGNLIWGRGSERLRKDLKSRDGKFTNFACHYPSPVPSPVVGALEEYEEREQQEQ